MKAIKFVILGAGILGLIAFFLPYAKVNGTSFSAMKVMQGVSLAEDAVAAARNATEDGLTEDATDETRASVKTSLNDIDEVLDTIKGIIIIMFAPTFLFILIGGIGAARGKLERLGGVGVMILGLIGLAINGIFLAAWGTPEVKDAGGSAGIAQYFLVISCVTGFIGGLLTVIKPDRGGKFA